MKRYIADKCPRELPYEFDLLYDVKTMRDVEDIAKGRPSRCDATPRQIIKLFYEHEMELPKCLLDVWHE